MNQDKYKTDFGEDTLSKIADGFCKNNIKQEKKYCSNCHREIYSSNYTETNLCSECKRHYYNESGSYKK